MNELDLYVTNTETIYPDYDDPYNGAAVRLYCRNPDDWEDQRTVTVTGFEPYFFILTDHRSELQPAEHGELRRFEDTNVVPLEDRFKPVYEQRDLTKVVVEHPGAIRKLKKQYPVTWAGDVEFTNRFRIDKDIRSGIRLELEDAAAGNPHYMVDHRRVAPVDIDDVDSRVCVLDIETDDRDSGFPEPGEARILSIAAHDSYTDEMTVFIDTDGEDVDDFFGLDDHPAALSELGINEADRLVPIESEREMLRSFSDYIQHHDPDILSGWNSGDSNEDGFDFPHLFARMDECNLSPARLAREDRYDLDHYKGDWTTDLQGRSTYDLMDAWASTKFTEPDSKKLDRVAQDVLDDAKIEHPDMGYFEMYQQDPVKFLNYNAKDTWLTVDIGREENVFGFKKRLKDIVGVDWEEVRQNRYFVDMSVRRKCKEHGVVMYSARDNPRRESSSDDGVNYEGAYVFPAFEGVKHNLVGVDLASLYPMTQWMLNASPDTKLGRVGEDFDPAEMDLPERDDDSGFFEYVKAANGVCFRTDVDSIIRELVDEYHELKAEFKQQRNACEYGTDEWEEMAEAYNVTKTIYNSYYGYTGWALSPIYDPEVAAAVTLTGQRVIKRTAEYIESETAGEIVYGDTDSNYVQFPENWDQEMTLEYAETVCEELTGEVYPELCDEFFIDPADNRWEIELEMRAESFFMHGKKKWYAYLKTWDEGDPFDEQVNDGDGKFDVTGYHCVKSSTSQITKDCQREVLEQIVRGADKSEVAATVFEYAQEIDAQTPDWEYLGIPQGLGKDMSREKAWSDDYYNWSKTGDHPQDAHPRAAWFSNHLLDVEYSKGSKPMRAAVKPGLTVEGESVDVIAYDYESDLDPVKDDLTMDVPKQQEKVLYDPLKKILPAFGLEPEAALRGDAHTQSGLGAFS